MSIVKTICNRTEAPSVLAPKDRIAATFDEPNLGLPSMEGRVRRELSSKLDELFRAIDGHPNQMLILTGLVYEMIIMLDQAGVVPMEDFSLRYVQAITGEPTEFNVATVMNQRTFRGLGTDLL